jgi:hypothetical protein
VGRQWAVSSPTRWWGDPLSRIARPAASYKSTADLTLNKTCSADIPERGEFFSHEEYVQRRFDGPGYRPDGQVLLLDENAIVGLCPLSFAPERDWAFIEMTGILRPYRRRGYATAVKRYAIE